MAEERDDGFVNYYEVLQIDKNADSEAIQRVYRILASRYHPDNTETGDIEKFLRVKDSYKVLSDPKLRNEYDQTLDKAKSSPIPVFLTREFTEGVEGEINRRMGVLCLLYNQRKTAPGQPSLSMLDIESMMFIPREHLTFTVWYLKSKRFVINDDRSSLMITADGIDFLEANLTPKKTLYKLLQSAEMGTARQTHYTTGWADVPADHK